MNDQCTNHRMSIRDDSSPARCTRCGITYAAITTARGDRVESVGRTAIRPGYVVVSALRGTPGAPGRIYRRVGDDERRVGDVAGGVVHISQDEQAVVVQLVTSKLLKVGPSITAVVVAGRNRRALLVVMPDTVQVTFEKWCSERPRPVAPDLATSDVQPVEWLGMRVTPEDLGV